MDFYFQLAERLSGLNRRFRWTTEEWRGNCLNELMLWNSRLSAERKSMDSVLRYGADELFKGNSRGMWRGNC